ncbi:AAA family ATPase [Kribbella sp. NBC_01510]|uniref:ATP-binding protein n=1 Tax=Kribbella sp. NBC_01510 TaxID=2903581 RepID=UPI003867F06C
MGDVVSSLRALAASPAGPAADWRRPFERLDSLLAAAVAEARVRFGSAAGHDSFRGLYISDDQAADVLSRPLGEPLCAHRAGVPDRSLEPAWADIAAHHEGWAWLRDTIGLTDVELDVLLIALAPEADLRYERLYGYLQDDVSRRRPTVDLVLDLVSSSAGEKLARRALFAADAPLLDRLLLRLAGEERVPLTPLLAQTVVVDEQVTSLLLLQHGLDRQLAAHCRLTTSPRGRWAETPLPPEVRQAVLHAARAANGRHPLRIHLHGPAGSGRRAAAEALAGELRLPVLTLSTAYLPSAYGEAATVVTRAFREAELQGALLFISDVDALPSDGPAGLVETLVELLVEHSGISVLAGSQPWSAIGDRPIGLLEVAFGRPDLPTRRAAWARCLDQSGVASSPELVDTLAGRFSFGPARIAEAVASAVVVAGGTGQPTENQLFATARRQTGHRLTALARRIEPACSWADLVLPPDTTTQLEELCSRVRLRSTVLHAWGFDRKLPRGQGTSALFTGPPGTGKTTAAEVVAGELALDLLSIDLSAVVSKYIGETEKNLEQIFSAAAEADAILMFDEADALFGKRSEVHDAHDRYANIETSYLLQRMEQYDGIAILATNLRENLDEAFTRRLQFVVDFPFPDETQREGIWRVSFPAEAPVDDDVDIAALARDFRLSGAGIKNAVLHAAYLAAAQGRPIERATVLRAIRREFQKMGRLPPEPFADQGR